MYAYYQFHPSKGYQRQPTSLMFGILENIHGAHRIRFCFTVFKYTYNVPPCGAIFGQRTERWQG